MDFYLNGIGFGDPEWIEHRLRVTGERWGCTYAEELDAWETVAGARVESILPAPPLPGLVHPERR